MCGKRKKVIAEGAKPDLRCREYVSFAEVRCTK